MKTILNNILDHLTTEIPALKYVDENWGQLDYYAPSHPVKYPCALADVNNAEWSDLGNLCQTGLAQVRITVADMKIGNTSKAAPASQRQKAFEIIDLMTGIHRALHGWRPVEHASRLTRTATRLIQREDGIKQYEMLFAIQISDETAQPQYAAASASPEIII